MSRWVFWSLVTLLSSSCHRDAKPDALPPAPATDAAAVASPVETPERAAEGVSRKATPTERAAVDELVRAAESVRQLRLEKPVQIEIEDGAAIAASLRAQIEEEEIERARIVYGAIGLLDTDDDLQSVFAGVLGEQVIGYYDPETGRLVIREDVMSGLTGAYGPEQMQEARLVLVHEIVHALQDQRLGLGESYQEDRSADADNAFRAVVEGDATLAMLAHALRQQGIPLAAATSGIQQIGSYLDLDTLVRGEKLDDAPVILRVTLVAPYLRGLQFMAAVQGRGGWPAVNNAHRRPPLSSEQVLHPDKYFAREPGEAIDVVDSAPVLRTGFERAADDTLGELEISVYLGQQTKTGTAAEAAEGWAGDHLVVYTRGDELAAVWWMSWDTEADAAEAYQAARRVAPKGSESHVERRGRAVLVVRGLPPKLHRAVRGDFRRFADEIESKPAPPELRPSIVY